MNVEWSNELYNVKWLAAHNDMKYCRNKINDDVSKNSWMTNCVAFHKYVINYLDEKKLQHYEIDNDCMSILWMWWKHIV